MFSEIFMRIFEKYFRGEDALHYPSKTWAFFRIEVILSDTIRQYKTFVSIKSQLIFRRFISVEGGQRAIIFSRIGGIQSEIYSEGLHFR